METTAKQLVHDLYNDLMVHEAGDTAELETALLKVYRKLDRVTDEAPLIARLVNYLYFESLSKNWQFTSEQSRLIQGLRQIAKTAGLNSNYRGDLSSLSQFD